MSLSDSSRGDSSRGNGAGGYSWGGNSFWSDEGLQEGEVAGGRWFKSLCGTSMANWGIFVCVRSPMAEPSAEPSAHALERKGQKGPIGVRRTASASTPAEMRSSTATEPRMQGPDLREVRASAHPLCGHTGLCEV